MRALPIWTRALGVALVALIVNLFWHHPLREATGDSVVAFFALNLLPLTAAVGWVILGGGRPRR
jgi:hypothetical protein